MWKTKCFREMIWYDINRIFTMFTVNLYNIYLMTILRITNINTIISD